MASLLATELKAESSLNSSISLHCMERRQFVSIHCYHLLLARLDALQTPRVSSDDGD